AHPVRPESGETFEGNIAAALRWLRALHELRPDWTTIAPWIPECQIYGGAGDADAAVRAASLERGARVAAGWHAGAARGRPARPGMRVEARAVFVTGQPVYDLTAGYRDSLAAASLWTREGVDLQRAAIAQAIRIGPVERFTTGVLVAEVLR